MLKDLLKKYIYPVAVLSGSIGVGFLSLPYIALKAGFWITVAYLVFLTAIIITIHLVFSKISLATPDFKRYPGFVKHHLGKWAEKLAFLTSIMGYSGVLLVYLIVGGEFLTEALSPLFGGNNFIYTLAYFILGTIIITFGIKAVSKIELFSIALLFGSLIFIFVKNFFHIEISNFFSGTQFDFKTLFLPYGAILFSLWGVGLIPETEEMLRGNKELMKKVIILGSIIPAIIYVLFITMVLGITGPETTESALVGLKNFLGNGLGSFTLLVGAIVIFVAFCVHGLTFKKVLNYDLKIKNWQAIVIACFTPMVLFLLGFKEFISILSIIGGVFLGIDGILILLMYKKIGGKNIIIYPLSLVFLLGIIYEIWSFK